MKTADPVDRAPGEPDAVGDERVSRADGWPLTPFQRAMVMRWLSAPQAGHYVQQLLWREVRGLEPERVRQAWAVVSARHPALRLRFQWEGIPEPRQFVEERVEVLVRVIRVADEAGVGWGLEDYLREDRVRGFDLGVAPLWRVGLLETEPGVWQMVWSFHHLLLDGRSHARVFEEWRSVYESMGTGTTAELSPAVSFLEFLDALVGRPMDQALRYWAGRLAGFVGAPGLPTLALDVEDGVDHGDNVEATLLLGEDETGRLRAAAERHGVTLNTLVQGAWALVLARYNGVEDVTFGTVRAGSLGRRWDLGEPDRRIGLFVDTVPFRVDVAPGMRLGPWLAGLRRQQVALRGAEHVSREDMRRAAGLSPREWLFRSVLMFESYDPAERLSGGGIGVVELREKIDIPALAAYAGRRLRLVLTSPGRLHRCEAMRDGVGHVKRLLLEMAGAGPEVLLGDLAMATEEEQRRIALDWQGRVEALPDRPFHRLLEARARAMPEAPALEFEGRVYGYGVLHAWANRMARRLREWAKPGDRVCVVLDRCPEQPVVWLAALKAGLVYAPVDPGNPPGRLAFFLRDLAPSVVVTQRAFAAAVTQDGVRVVCVDDAEERGRIDALDDSELVDEPDPEGAACILYTSGSTGMPKGSVLTHRGLRHFWVTLNGAFDIGPGDRVLLACPTSFDGSLWDMGQALQTGATMVGALPERMATGPALADLLETARITAFMPTPTRLKDLPERAFPDLRWILPAGEVLPAALVERWGSGRRMMNIFGPTECTVWATGELCVADGWRPVIGRLRENVRGYVLDDALRPVPVGVPGQLYLGGSGVGGGYWNRPELTAERFLPDPFSSEAGARMYRTGDRVRWLWDGRLDFIERLDHQVKYRGARIELGEIESHLVAHGQVAEAAVVLVGDRLVAWLVVRDEAPTPDGLRAWLSERLQIFFIPTEFRFVEKLPRTISGKVDRAWLAERGRSEVGVADGVGAFSPGVLAGGGEVPLEWTRNDGDFPRERSVVDLFREQVRGVGMAVAIEDGARRISYGELDALSDAVAVRLEREGILDEELVAVVLDGSWEFVVAILGIVKAGGSYVPMGVGVPAARLAFLLKDSGVRVVVTVEAHAGVLEGWTGTVVCLNALGEEGGRPVGVVSDPSRRAYVLYTSGSTGQPKGVEIEHHSLTNLVWFYRERLGLKPGDRATLLAHVTFDASVADIWPSLCTGGTLLIPPKGVLADVDDLMGWLVSSRATFTFVATALAEVLLARPWPAGVALRYLATGGDTLHGRPPRGLPFTVLNTYGPTENTVDSTWAVVLAGEGGERPSIGRPIRNVRVLVVDEAGREVGVGGVGELLLGGEQVARGYLGRPELTAETFVVGGGGGEGGGRWYRTGDWVRWNREGELEFLGRRDDQIQIRGRRVELAEVEACIWGLGGMRQVCCVPEEEGGGISGVVAHVVPEVVTEGLGEALRARVAAVLPAYMVPGRFEIREGLPMNAAGKVDRAALRRERLPAPPVVELNPEGDGLEQALVRLWWQLFPSARGALADVRFWELGGDSLMAIRLVLGVQEITGVRMPVSSFLLEPTLSGLTRSVRAQMAQGDASRVLALRRRGERPPLFCVYAVGGDVGVYFALADALGEDQPVFGIRSPAAGGRAEDLPGTLEAAAADVIRWIRTVQPEGPPALVGYSFGGMLAFEVGRQLVREGGDPPFVAVLGTHPPVVEIGMVRKAWHFVRWFPHWLWRTGRDRATRRERMGRIGGMARRARENFQEAAGAMPAMPDWARHPIVSGNIELAMRYRPEPGVPLVLDLFRETKTFRREGHPLEPAVTTHLWDSGWGRWAGARPRVHWLDMSHDDVYRHPGVQELAVALRAAMDAHARRRG